MALADAFRHYSKIVSRASVKTFSCPECKIDILPKNYEVHCTKYHNINSKLQCVWCRGSQSWPSGKKKQNVDHLINCFRKFIHIIESPPLKPYILFDHTPMCPAKDFFGHKKLLFSDRLYETIWPLNLEEYDDNDRQLVGGLLYQNPNINKAVSYMRYFLKNFKDDIDTFHIMVKPNIYDNFAAAMDRDGGQSRTLEFSCWCDGGKHEIDKYRQHKHMIVFSKPKGHFIPNVWKKIQTTDDKPYKNFPSLRLKRIDSPMHFVNTIGYLSRRKSRCNFTFDNRNKLKKGNMNHFYIATELPTNYKVPLVTQWEDGLMNLLQHMTYHIDQSKLIEISEVVDGRRQIQVKKIPGVPLNIILPVAATLAPTTIRISSSSSSSSSSTSSNEKGHSIHLTKERIMRFDSFDNNNDDDNNNNNNNNNNDNWIRLQIDGGNLFFNVVGDEYVNLRPKHQRFLNDIQPIINENVSLKKNMEKFNSNLDKLTEENANLKNLLEKNMEIFNSNMDKLKEENTILKTLLEKFKNNLDSLQNVTRELKRKLKNAYTTIINNHHCTIMGGQTSNNNNNKSGIKRRRMSE